jgi:pilus assembly protein CpaB
MRMIFGLVLIAGMALAGFAVYMAQGYINQTENALTEERAFREMVGDMVQVYVAAKPLVYGQTLTKEDVKMIYWQASALPENPFTAEEDLFPADEDKPRYVLRAVDLHEPILATKVTAPGQPAGLTGLLAPGMRAFAISVDASTGVSGFVHPGDFVDIYWTTSSGTGSDVTRLIETRVNVVAVDQQAAGDDIGGAVVAQTVTIQGMSETVARLAQAQATGRLSLALVGQGDQPVMNASDISADNGSLMGEVAAIEEKICSIKTRKGSEVVEIPIPCTN